MTKEKYIETVKNREKNSVVQDLQWLIQCLNDTISDIHKDKITVDELPKHIKYLLTKTTANPCIGMNSNRNIERNKQ